MNPFSATPACVFVFTRDPSNSRPFYAGVLGLTQMSVGDYSTVYDLNGSELHLTTVKDHVASLHPVLGWAVTDIRATARDLMATGISFIIYDGYGQDEIGIYAAPDGSSKMAWFTDPDGNILSLSEG